MLPIFVACATLLAAAAAGLTNEPWISIQGEVRPELAASQVLLIKDEDLGKDKCLSATEERDLRYADKRYLMCSGSILNSRLILTSASCIHHATHVRHNIIAPLAVLIAPFSKTSQIIKIVYYTIHPFYAVNPEDYDHAVHDVAVAKLACRIMKDNLKPVKLPNQPLEEECAENNCFVATFRTNSMLRYSMRESIAKDMEYVLENPSGLDTSDDFDSDNEDDIPTSQNENINKRESKEIPQESSKKSDGSSTAKENPKKPDDNKNPNDAPNAGNADVLHYCTLFGAPVMYNNIQPALVSESCDEIQRNSTWSYTDLYDNLDWLDKILRISSATTSCGPCIYLSACHGQGHCSKDTHGKSSNVSTQSTPHTCLKHRASNSKSENRSRNKPNVNNIQSRNRVYFDEIHKMYRNRSDPPEVNEGDNGLND